MASNMIDEPFPFLLTSGELNNDDDDETYNNSFLLRTQVREQSEISSPSQKSNNDVKNGTLDGSQEPDDLLVLPGETAAPSANVAAPSISTGFATTAFEPTTQVNIDANNSAETTHDNTSQKNQPLIMTSEKPITITIDLNWCIRYWRIVISHYLESVEELKECKQNPSKAWKRFEEQFTELRKEQPQLAKSIFEWVDDIKKVNLLHRIMEHDPPYEIVELLVISTKDGEDVVVPSAAAAATTPPTRETRARMEADAKWVAKLQLLKEYKKCFGHCRVPKRYAEIPGLGRWVQMQRQMYKGIMEGNKKVLEKNIRDRIEALEELGFDWKVGYFYNHENPTSKFPKNESMLKLLEKPRCTDTDAIPKGMPPELKKKLARELKQNIQHAMKTTDKRKRAWSRNNNKSSANANETTTGSTSGLSIVEDNDSHSIFGGNSDACVATGIEGVRNSSGLSSSLSSASDTHIEPATNPAFITAADDDDMYAGETTDFSKHNSCDERSVDDNENIGNCIENTNSKKKRSARKYCCFLGCKNNDNTPSCKLIRIPPPQPILPTDASDNRRKTRAIKADIRKELLIHMGIDKHRASLDQRAGLRYCNRHGTKIITRFGEFLKKDGNKGFYTYSVTVPSENPVAALPPEPQKVEMINSNLLAAATAASAFADDMNTIRKSRSDEEEGIGVVLPNHAIVQTKPTSQLQTNKGQIEDCLEMSILDTNPKRASTILPGNNKGGSLLNITESSSADPPVIMNSGNLRETSNVLNVGNPSDHVFNHPVTKKRGRASKRKDVMDINLEDHPAVAFPIMRKRGKALKRKDVMDINRPSEATNVQNSSATKKRGRPSRPEDVGDRGGL